MADRLDVKISGVFFAEHTFGSKCVIIVISIFVMTVKDLIEADNSSIVFQRNSAINSRFTGPGLFKIFVLLVLQASLSKNEDTF